MYQRVVQLGWLGENFYKLMYRALMPHPSLYRWAMRFYAADTRSMYANPDMKEIIERTFSSYCRLDLDANLSGYCGLFVEKYWLIVGALPVLQFCRNMEHSCCYAAA